MCSKRGFRIKQSGANDFARRKPAGCPAPGCRRRRRNQSLQKDLSRTWSFAIIVRASESPRCEIYRGRYTKEVYLIPECEPETNKTKKKSRVLYSIRPVV